MCIAAEKEKKLYDIQLRKARTRQEDKYTRTLIERKEMTHDIKGCLVECETCNGTGKISIVTLGDYLKHLRNSNGLSLREVAEETGISNAYLSHIETGKGNEISFSKAIKLCEFYGINIADLAATQERDGDD